MKYSLCVAVGAFLGLMSASIAADKVAQKECAQDTVYYPSTINLSFAETFTLDQANTTCGGFKSMEISDGFQIYFPETAKLTSKNDCKIKIATKVGNKNATVPLSFSNG